MPRRTKENAPGFEIYFCRDMDIRPKFSPLVRQEQVSPVDMSAHIAVVDPYTLYPLRWSLRRPTRESAMPVATFGVQEA